MRRGTRLAHTTCRRSTSTPSRCEPTTRSAGRSAVLVPTKPSSPWKASIDRLAAEVGISGWEMRYRNAVTPGVVWGPGQMMDDGALGAKACLEAIKPAYDEAVAEGQAVGLGFGLKNSGLGNGLLEVIKAVVRFFEDGTVEVRHCWTEMGQGVHTVALQVAVEELGDRPDASPCRGRHHKGARGRPDDRLSGHGHGRRRGRRRLPARSRRRLPAGRRLRGRVPGRLDQFARGGPREPGHSCRVLLRGSARGHRPRDRQDRQGGRRPRRRTGRQSPALRGPDPRRGAHGPRLCPLGGFPLRRGGPAAEHDASQPRDHPGQGRPADRDHPRRGAPAQVPLRDQGCRRDRPGADRGSRGEPRLHDLDGLWRSTLPMRTAVGAAAGNADE